MQITYVDPGEMLSLVDFVDPGVNPLDEGEEQTIYSGIPARIRQTRSSETLKSKQVVDQVITEVAIKYLPGLKTRYRVKFEDKTFDIWGIRDPDMLHVDLLIDCVELGDGD